MSLPAPLPGWNSAAAASGAAARADAPTLAPAALATRWQRLPAPAGVDRAAALALDAERGRLAVGGERGVALGPLEGPLERVFARGPVRDLAFAPDGSLLVASEAGLYRLGDAGRATALTLAPGEAARSVRDLSLGCGWMAAASGAGVHVSRDGEVWQRARALPFGPATRVALESRGAACLLWAVIEGALWSCPLDGGGVARRAGLPEALEGEGVIALATGVAGADVVALSSRGLAVFARARGGWRSESLALPPGAEIRRVGAALGGVWIATDSGLLVAPTLAGPWRRAGAPAGQVAVAAVAASNGALFVASARGLLRAVSAPPASHPSTSARGRRGDPPIQAVQRAALRYLALEPERLRRLRRGVARRGWLPDVSVAGGWKRGRDWGEDYDETFTSGATRRLRDHDRGHDEDFDVSVLLSWDLGDVAFHDASIDVSRESRLVAQLRDDVLDELTQLYFERQRVLARLEAPSPEASPVELRLRAAELASGIDAWTGGWFSEQLRTAADAAASATPLSGPALPAEESSP